MINVSRYSLVRSILVVIFTVYMAMSQTMGPYDFEIRTFENCERHAGDKILFESRMNKYNRSIYTISAQVYLGIDADDSLTAHVDLALFTNGGWKENFYKQKFTEGCSTIRRLAPKPVASILKSVGLEDRCPFPKGNYTLKAWPLKFELNFIPTFFYGKYRFTVMIKKDDRRIGCLRTVVDIIPKKKH
ncbi:Hypothetical protein NTJ_09837 [Nesidiocoris tenuis]|nr:Hypothetical protein NTJ_09837 [Nesidiocoris tenuis]